MRASHAGSFLVSFDGGHQNAAVKVEGVSRSPSSSKASLYIACSLSLVFPPHQSLLLLV
jgi:hypothetical protein